MSFGYVFPAIKGIQANRDYYISMCPLRLIPKIFLFDEEEIVPELRAQRTLNRARLPEMSNYIVRNKRDYIFSALTASIDGKVNFIPITDDERMGELHVPMDARFLINDGQHRRAAIEMALKEAPELADETISVVFFIDIGLKRSQQMFADLNRYAIRPSASIGVLYDQRDEMGQLTKLFILKSECFKAIVDLEKSALSSRSRKLFTLSALNTASQILIQGIEDKTVEEKVEILRGFWEGLYSFMPEWQRVKEMGITAGEIRQNYIHSHGVTLKAFSIIGNHYLLEGKTNWKELLKPLTKLDWSRNSKLWEGRAVSGGRLRNSDINAKLTAIAMKKKLKISLTVEEKAHESSLEELSK